MKINVLFLSVDCAFIHLLTSRQKTFLSFCFHFQQIFPLLCLRSEKWKPSFFVCLLSQGLPPFTRATCFRRLIFRSRLIAEAVKTIDARYSSCYVSIARAEALASWHIINTPCKYVKNNTKKRRTCMIVLPVIRLKCAEAAVEHLRQSMRKVLWGRMGELFSVLLSHAVST